jgi:hypothetical protein
MATQRAPRSDLVQRVNAGCAVRVEARGVATQPRADSFVAFLAKNCKG